MIKIVGVIGSPKYKGNSATLLRQTLEGAKNKGAKTEEIFLSEHNLKFCKGCSNCLRYGKCTISDDLEYIKEKLISADGIVMSSPTHGLEPSALMKNFMDRIGLFAAYTSLLSDKYVVGISTTGAVGAKKVAKKLTSINGGFLKTGYVSGTLAVALDWDHAKDYPRYLKKAYALGETLTTDIKTGKKYYTQKLFSKMINSLILKRTMKNNILKHKDGRMKAVYRYLTKKGK